ncbi:MAG: hypothetical protein ACRDPC_04295 [Solirubrobacteraceae bacterium]
MASLTALLTSCSGGAKTGTAAPPRILTGPFEPSASAPAPPLPPGAFAVTAGTVVYQAAADRNHVVWETGPVQGAGPRTALLQRDLRSGRRTTLALEVFPGYGLASTTGWVVYAEGLEGRRLVAIAHDGSKRIVLSHSLAAPMAARGELVAWAEERQGVQQVIVRDMAKGAAWLAAKRRRCEQGRCHHIGAVALADRGVVFTRNASGPDTSLVVRRSFADARVSTVKIVNDPQPDLVPSSAGALYHAFGRGWYRWDFGQTRPRRASFPANSAAQLLGYEHGRWFILTHDGCEAGVVAVRDAGRRTRIGPPPAVRARAAHAHRTCIALGSLAWTGRQALTAWGLVPAESLEGHSDAGIAGVGHIGAALP